MCRPFLLLLVVPLAHALRSPNAQYISSLRLSPPQSRDADADASLVRIQDTSLPPPTTDLQAQWFRQPLDHFAERKHESDTWLQRFWVNARYYSPAERGPVIVLDAGETSGEDRLPHLDTGIVNILARATGGIGIVLEHRYYGTSIPVANLSTDSLRWLTNEQAAADSANFMANVKLDGIEEDLTAPGTPWIYYGGSYAGARAAHMRILYPDLVYGAIASSPVTHATLENWQYMDIIRQAADPKCIEHIENAIKIVDHILAVGYFKRALKSLFGLADLEHDEDFVSVLMTPMETWQDKNWDPKVGSTVFDEFCSALQAPFGHKMSRAAADQPFGHPKRLIEIEDGLAVDFAVFNYGKWVKTRYVANCTNGMSIEECFGTFDDEKFRGIGLNETWRLWLFQVCTQWGYFDTAPPDQNIPRIVSRLLTLDYASKICRQAFPPGEHFRVPTLPNITAVNALGDFDIAADRLAIIDGEVDPWRPNTPHSANASNREDTITRPFKLIPGGVHHYDENGLRKTSDEPIEIRTIHEEMIGFVQAWMREWEETRRK